MLDISLSNRYWGSFGICTFLCIGLLYFVRSSSSSVSSSKNVNNGNNEKEKASKFPAFQTNYLFVFMLAMFSDWLQGPYVYELYVSYGFSQVQIAELFVCGFGSSMIVGTFIGGLADKLGRKVMCIMYCVCYIIACCTKLVPEYWTLMLGRFLSGVSTSLLFSVFESWMVCEHNKNGYDSNFLNDTFSLQTFGNGLVAVIAGLIANSAADAYGFVAPFIVAIFPLTIVAIVVMLTWTENYGNQQLNLLSSLSKGFELVRSDSRIAALGFAQSCFEGAMYTFVFMWTPALKSDMETIAEQRSTSSTTSGQEAIAIGDVIETTSSYLGLIFSVFMICVMIGSSCFKYFSTKRENLYKIPLYMHLIAFLSMLVVTVFLQHKTIVYIAFLIFEASVGVFYPSYGVIKSEKIPEDIRYRLYCIVVAVE